MDEQFSVQLFMRLCDYIGIKVESYFLSYLLNQLMLIIIHICILLYIYIVKFL